MAKVLRVNGVEVTTEDLAAVATEKAVAPNTPEAVEGAIDLYLIRAYAKQHGIEQPAETSGPADEMSQLEVRIFDKAPPPPPGDEPYLTVDHAYLFVEKVPKAEKKKARAAAEAFRKASAADASKAFETIFAEQKLSGEYWHSADGENYAASLFPWLPADLKIGETSKVHATADASEFVRLRARYEGKFSDRHVWLVETLRSGATIDRP